MNSNIKNDATLLRVLGSRLAERPPAALCLDVRGTLLKPEGDEPLQNTLSTALTECLRARIPLALLTGCSIETVQRLILDPMNRLQAFLNQPSEHLPNLFHVYTGTGGEGYRIDCGMPERLLDYTPLQMSLNEQNRVIEILRCAAKNLGFDISRIETRPAQVNCYLVEAKRSDRVRWAKQIQDQCVAEETQFYVHAPTSKNVIDVSLGRKTRAGQHFLQQLPMFNTVRSPLEKRIVWAVSDSFQRDGADALLLDTFKRVIGIHVGETDSHLHRKALPFPGGPHALHTILSYALKLASA